jgi:hypothetical protein
VSPQILYLGKLNISKLTKRTRNILIIVGRNAFIVGFEKPTITLPMGTQVTIENALLYFDSTRTLLSYRDICKNELHIVTHEENNKQSLRFYSYLAKVIEIFVRMSYI